MDEDDRKKNRASEPRHTSTRKPLRCYLGVHDYRMYSHEKDGIDKVTPFAVVRGYVSVYRCADCGKYERYCSWYTKTDWL